MLSSLINAKSSGQNQPDNMMNPSSESIVGKIFEGEMFIRTLPITLLQIFCKIIFNSKVIVKSIIDPDYDFWKNL